MKQCSICEKTEKIEKYEFDLKTNSNSYVFKSENYYIDSMFGIGLKRDVTGIYKEIFTIHITISNNDHKCARLLLYPDVASMP